MRQFTSNAFINYIQLKKKLPKNRFLNSEGDNLSAKTFMNCSVQSEILRRNSFMNTELN